MSHAEALYQNVRDRELRDKINSWLKAPPEKLGFGHVFAGDTTFEYLKIQETHPELIGDMSIKAYNADPKRFGSAHPVDVRLLNVNALVEQDQAAAVALQKEICDDLHTLGCKVIPYCHKPLIWEECEDFPPQHCVALPCTYPLKPAEGEFLDWRNGIPMPQFQRDIEGTGLMLAYLLERKLVTRDEVQEAYRKNFLEEADRQDYRAAVRALLHPAYPSTSTSPFNEGGIMTSTPARTPGGVTD